jgi:hypothetical protein
MVLFVASLALTSFVKLLRTDLGFDRSNLALARIVGAPPADAATSLGIWRQLLARLEQVPGVESASLSPWGLFEGSGRNKTVQIPGRSLDGYRPWYLPVSPRFLESMGIPLVAGRDFEWGDARPEVPSAVIVNESFARRYFPGTSPLGQTFMRVDGGAILVAQEIIGVARDAKYTDIREPAPPTVYEVFQPAGAAVVQVRTRLEGEALLSALGDALTRTNGGLRLDDLTWQARLVDNMLVSDRMLALLSVFFSLAAMILVIVGLYGILSYGLVQRTQEFGIRLALGARPRELIGVMCADVGSMVVVGVVIGAAGAVYATKYVSTILFEASPAGLVAVATPLLCLFVVCVISAIGPATRLLRIDPTQALRNE